MATLINVLIFNTKHLRRAARWQVRAININFSRTNHPLKRGNYMMEFVLMRNVAGRKQCFTHVISEKVCGMDCDMEMAGNSALICSFRENMWHGL